MPLGAAPAALEACIADVEQTLGQRRKVSVILMIPYPSRAQKTPATWTATGGVKILMFRLGTVNAQRLARHQELGQEPPSLHCPAYYPDAEESLQTGLVAMYFGVSPVSRTPASCTR